MSALHVTVPAAAATISADSPDSRQHPDCNQPGDGPAERFPINGAALGDSFNLYGAVLRGYLGRTQQQQEVAYDYAPRTECDPGVAAGCSS